MKSAIENLNLITGCTTDYHDLLSWSYTRRVKNILRK